MLSLSTSLVLAWRLLGQVSMLDGCVPRHDLPCPPTSLTSSGVAQPASMWPWAGGESSRATPL